MLILSVDTTTRAGSAAVIDNGRVLVELSGDPSLTHGQRLPSDLARVLEAAGASVQDVELFAVAAGPGSFTGLRVGIATVQGLAMAAGRRVVPVSTLDALARIAALERGVLNAAWMDAQRGEVFAALYDAIGRQLLPPSAADPEVTLDAWAQHLNAAPVIFAGEGAVRYREVIRARLGPRARVTTPAPAMAGAIGSIAWEQRDRAVLPHAVVPVYVRRPDAELARARRQGPGGSRA